MLTFSLTNIFLLGIILVQMIKSESLITEEPEDTFIINLINEEQYVDCSVVVFQDRFDNDDSVTKIIASVSQLPAQIQKSVYSIKYNFPDAAELETLEQQLKDFGLQISDVKAKGQHQVSELGNKTVTLESFLATPEALPVQFRWKISNFRRMGNPCMAVIMMVNDIRPQFMKQIYHMLTPVYIPITRKDEDHYIFKTRPEFHLELLTMGELPMRIKFKIAMGSKNPGNYLTISTICFFCDPGGTPRLVQLPVGTDNLPLDDTEYFPDFVWDLNGRLLYVAFPYMKAKIEAEYPYHGLSNAWRGHWKMLFEEFLSVRFNFTYNMFAATGRDGEKGGGGTGVQLKDGSWIGVTGDLISGRADLGIGILNTPKRIHYIDFTNSFYDVGCLTFVTPLPSRIFSPAALLWPFDLLMWFCIGLSTLLSIAFFNFVFTMMKRYNIGEGDDWPFRIQVQFLVSTFLENDSPVLPKSHTLRVFVIFWFFYTMVLTTIYSSKMVELLAFPVLGTVPLTFQDLAFSGYGVGFLRHGDSAYLTLAASHDPVYVKLVADMEIYTGYGEECIDKVVKGGYGCIAYDFSLIHLRERNMSDSDTRKVTFAPDSAYHSVFGLGTEGKSIYRLNFGQWLSYTRAFHLPDIWDKMDMYYNVRIPKINWWKETNQTEKLRLPEEESSDLTLKHILGAFYVLIACLSISTAVFLYEIFSYRRTEILINVATSVAAAANAAVKRQSVTKRGTPVEIFEITF